MLIRGDNMANITFYINSSDNRVLNKNLRTLKTVNFNITDVCSVENPNIELANADLSLINANYCYIDIFDRYYYCTVSIMQNMATVECNVDVLMSYRASINQATALCNRTTNHRLTNLVDNKVALKPRLNIDYYEFPTQIFVNNNFTQSTKCCTLEILGS